MNWEECLRRKIVKKISTDRNLVSSLIGTSKRRLITDGFAPLNDDTASTKIVNNHDSMREILEAVAVFRGFKIYNHDCFVGFIFEVLKLPDEANRFDKFRRIRNGINYYGENIGVVDAKILIDEINDLRIKLLRVLNEE